MQVAALLLLFTTSAWIESAHLSALADPDVWWHLSTGNWILQNHAVPHDGFELTLGRLQLALRRRARGSLQTNGSARSSRVVDGAENRDRDGDVCAGSRLAIELLACRSPGCGRAICNTQLAARAGCLLDCSVRNRIEFALRRKENRSRASAVLVAIVVPAVGEPGRWIYLRVDIAALV